MSKITNARPLNQIRHGINLLQNRKTLWQMVRDSFSGRYQMSWITILILFVALAYVLFPFDLIPDFIPVLGWLDDGAVVLLVLKRLVKETQRYNRFKAVGRKYN